MGNTWVLWMNVEKMGFPDGSFDVVLGGFMGWDYCFDFVHNAFTGSDVRMREIARVSREGGQVWICAWERQADLDWMEEMFIRHLPSIVSDPEFIERYPIGYSRENATGYDTIMKNAGLKNIEIFKETADFVSTDEEAWWEEIQNLGWKRFTRKVDAEGSNDPRKFKEHVWEELQRNKHADGIHFTKSVLFAHGVK